MGRFGEEEEAGDSTGEWGERGERLQQVTRQGKVKGGDSTGDFKCGWRER